MKNFNNVVLLTFSTLIAWVINYAYHPLMIRFLDNRTFSEFESLISLFNILWVLVGGIWFFLLKEISKNSHNLVKIKSIFVYSNKFLFSLWSLLYILFALISPFLADFLKIDSILPLLIIWLTIIISFASSVISPIMQWLERFKAMAFFAIFWSIIKLVFWVWFVILWFKLFWSLAWFIISSIIVFFFSFIYIYKLLHNHNTDIEIIKQVKADFKRDYKDLIHSFLLIFTLSIYMNIDIILAKNLFDNNVVAIYAWLSVIAKFMIFLGSTIETVYYPQIIKSDHIVFHFVRNAMWMITLLWIWAIWFLYLFGWFFLDILKKWYGEYNNLFLLLVLYCVFYITISLLSKILIWFKKYMINYILFIGIFVIFILSKYVFNSDIYTYIYAFLWVWFSMILLMIWMIFLVKGEK